MEAPSISNVWLFDAQLRTKLKHLWWFFLEITQRVLTYIPWKRLLVLLVNNLKEICRYSCNFSLKQNRDANKIESNLFIALFNSVRCFIMILGWSYEVNLWTSYNLRYSGTPKTHDFLPLGLGIYGISIGRIPQEETSFHIFLDLFVGRCVINWLLMIF